jgi:hypothetical protein
MLSRRFVERLKLGSRPAYRVAQDAGLHPATLSKLLSGAERIRPNDARVIAVGRILGLTAEECFDKSAAPGRTGGSDAL